jgi:sulfite reductase (NADPH) hemoprotein beta-component
MYRYDEVDQKLVDERVSQFRDQTQRFLAGALTEDEFKPLRLRNGLYVQRHAPMLRIAVPYGLLSSNQLRMMAHVARKYDRGYGHFTTRQNLQLNWPELGQVPDILAELATVQLHAIQTSGNCIRNITTDQFAGVAPDEVVDPLVWCELLRQWSTFHPEFNWLPRKFKIAVSGSEADRAATLVHDIGLVARRDASGEVGFRVLVGGGLGRAPMIGQAMSEFVPWQHLLTYLDAILRVYNREGRRDNIHKARIKFVVRDLGIEKFRAAVEQEWALVKDGPMTLVAAEIARIEQRFERTPYAKLPPHDAEVESLRAADRGFSRWYSRNVFAHRVPGYSAVTLSLKRSKIAPGDATSDEMEAIAALADRFSAGELRVTHEQNLVLADVRTADLPVLWREAKALGLATPNIGLLTDLIACPGGDFCSLANARSLPVAASIEERFADLDTLESIGDLELNISGCMNACGHHHVGHIGILGIDKHGAEFYQLELGGRQGNDARLGKVLGRALGADEIADAVERTIECYLTHRSAPSERFIQTFDRIGIEPFKEWVYGKSDQATSANTGLLAAA